MLSDAARLVLMVVLVVAIVAAIALGLGLRSVRAGTPPTQTSTSNPSVEQTVIWNQNDPQAPAHYVNHVMMGGVPEHAQYKTACGKVMENSDFYVGTLAEMKIFHRRQCPNCILAMQVYITPAYFEEK